MDGAHEVFLTRGYSLEWLTLFAEVYVESVRLRGLYAAFGITREVEVDAIVIGARLSPGLAAYDGEAFHLNDIRASLEVVWSDWGPLFLRAGGGCSLRGHPRIEALAMRSVAVFSLSVGAAVR